jgi:hypothetical protein
MSELERLREQTQVAIDYQNKHNKYYEENPPKPGPWKKCTFICPDCYTQITIRTRLPFENPFRVACPCKYSGMHKTSEWDIDPDQT